MTIRKICIGLLALVFVACSKTAPEEAILANIDAIQMAVEEKNTGDIVGYLTDNFSGSHDMDRKQIRRMIMGMFLRHQNINVLVTRMDIQHDPRRPSIATMEGIVLVTGAQGLVPDDGRLLNVTGEWQLHDGDWLLAQVEWE